jgi:hypothetical protein
VWTQQALAELHPTKPTRPGLIERREFEYVRHGTLCLTANLEVATGRLIAPRIAKGRTNEDFVEHVEATLAIGYRPERALDLRRR